MNSILQHKRRKAKVSCDEEETKSKSHTHTATATVKKTKTIMANLHDNKERIWYKTHAFNLSELIKLSGVGTVSRRSTSQWYSLASVFSRSANFLNEFLSIF